MKKTLVLGCLLVWTASAIAQQKKTAPKNAAQTAAKATTNQPQLKTLYDSASYALGVDMANFYKQQGFTGFNARLFSRACNDVLKSQPTLPKEGSANELMNKVMMKLQEEKAKPAVDAGNAFLSENKKKSGIKTTASGLQYEVIREGTGIRPTAMDTFVAHYRGTLIDGTQFDASYDHGQPLTLPVTSVIRGWTEGLQLMPAGSKYKFYIPYHLAYGLFDNGTIPGGSTLIFEVELLEVKKRNP